jgi:hypothetical protein
VVKYQNNSNSSSGSSDSVQPGDNNTASFSPLALQRWIEVTAGLTVITFLVAAVWLYWSKIAGNINEIISAWSMVRRNNEKKQERDMEKGD